MQRNQENNMSEKGLTNISLKKINKSKVYQYIYRKKKTSKQQIVQELQMGLSTVSQNLNLLEQEGLIEKNGFLHPPAEEKQTPFRSYPILKFLLVSVF